MLLRYKVKNYKSIADELVIDLTAGSIKEHQDSLITVNKINVLPLAAIFGANASGKSNLLESLVQMKREVLTSNGVFGNFYFDKQYRANPTEVEVCIYSKELNKEIRYGFAKLGKEIVEEWMFSKTFSTTPNLEEKCIFYRQKNQKLETEVKDTKEINEIEYVASMVGVNELILTAIGKRKNSKYLSVFGWFECLYALDFSEINVDFALYNQEFLQLLYENEEAKNDCAKVISKVDPAIKGFSIETELDDNMNEVYVVYSKHLDENNELIKVPFSTESCGTKKIFSMALFLIISLQLGRVFVCDELDSKLHPLLLRYIVRMFSNKETNVGGGQLIFTSHNLVCLDSSDLRRDEIWFVEKNNQKTNAFSLYDFKEESIRKDLDFGKHYLSGRFGAIPFN